MRIERTNRRPTSATSYLARVILMLSGLAFAVLLITNPHWISSPIDAFSRLGGFMAPHGMTRLMGTYGSGLMHAHVTADGDVLLVDKTLIHRYIGGDPETQAVVYDMQTARHQVGDVKLGSLSVATVAADGTIYTGSWRGLILRRDGDAWSVVIEAQRDADGKSIPGEYPASQVKAIHPVGDDLLVLSHGLWVVTPDGTATAVAGIDTTKLYTNAIAPLPDGGFVLGTSKGLYMVHPPTTDLIVFSGSESTYPEYEEKMQAAKSWHAEPFLPFETAGSVKAVAVHNDTIISVTSLTVTAFSLDGTQLSQVAMGESLESISIAPTGDWLVTCRKTGLYHYDGTSWQYVEFAEGLHDARVDHTNRLWAVIYSQAGLVGDLDRVLQDALPLTAPSAPPAP